MSFGPPPPHSAWTHSATAQVAKQKRKHSRLLGILVAMTVIVAASAAGAWLTLSRTDDTPSKSAKKQVARQLPGDVYRPVEQQPNDQLGTGILEVTDTVGDGGDTLTRHPGLWLTEKHLVRGRTEGGESRLDAFLLKPQQEKSDWQISLKGGICATTNDITVDGYTALVIGHKDKRDGLTCDQVVIVDLKRGKIKSQHSFSSQKYASPYGTTVAISQGTAAVTSGFGSSGYEIASGKRLWSQASDGKCAVKGYAGGGKLMAVLACTLNDSDVNEAQVAMVDPKTGKYSWVYRPSSQDHWELYIVSTDPIVVGIYARVDSRGISNAVVLNAKGAMQTSIALDTEISGAQCEAPIHFAPKSVDRCTDIVASNKYLYVSSQDGSVADSSVNNVAAYDLKTGRGVARFDTGKDGYSQLHVFQKNGDSALAIQENTANQPAALYELRVPGEEKRPYLYFLSDDTLDPLDRDLKFRQGTLAIANAKAEKGYLSEKVIRSLS